MAKYFDKFINSRFIMGLRRFFRPKRQEPLWKRTKQNLWWAGASIHADNTPLASPQWARDVWDEIIGLDPDAPEQYKPIWAIKTGGQSPLTDNFISEVKERTERGYRVIFTNKKDDLAALYADVKTLVDAGAKPWGVSAGNEPDLVWGLTPEETEIALADYPAGLAAVRDAFDVNIAAPGLATISNAAGDYGAVYNTLFSGMDRLFAKVHSYGHTQPKYVQIFDLKGKIQVAQGLPSDALVILEETANAFNKEHSKYLKEGVADEQGAEFLYAMALAGCQNKVPTCHFMLYHGVGNKHFNDISDKNNGALRRKAARKFINFVRTHETVGDLEDLELQNPKGKEVTEFPL